MRNGAVSNLLTGAGVLGWERMNIVQGFYISVNPTEYWIIYRGLGFLAAVVPRPPPLSSMSLTGDTQEDWVRETSCWREREGRGWARSQIIWPQESLVTLKSSIPFGKPHSQKPCSTIQIRHNVFFSLILCGSPRATWSLAKSGISGWTGPATPHPQLSRADRSTRSHPASIFSGTIGPIKRLLSSYWSWCP
jgi:hypothetical protein